MSESTLYVCRVCGYNPYNRADWCDSGCGSDYNQMHPVPATTDATLRAKIADLEAACGNLRHALAVVRADIERGTETRAPLLTIDNALGSTQAGRGDGIRDCAAAIRSRARGDNDKDRE